MIKNNGYIILSDIIPNWQKSIKKGLVVPNSLCGPFYNGYWINNLEGKNYFLKICNYNGLRQDVFVELLMEELAKMVSIPTVNSEIIKVNNKAEIYGLMSENYLVYGFEPISGKDIINNYLENLEKNGKLKENLNVNSLEDISKDFFEKEFSLNSLEFIWESLEYFYKNYSQKDIIIYKIMTELVERYIFAFITMQADFHLGNWEILDNGHTSFLAPLYDVDMGFDDKFINLGANNSMKSLSSNISNIYKDFERFLASSSSSFKLSFLKQFRILTPNVIKETLENIERKHGFKISLDFKNNIIKKFQLHYSQLQEIVYSLEIEEGRSL